MFYKVVKNGKKKKKNQHLFFLKTEIVYTRQNRLSDAVLTRTHNLYFQMHGKPKLTLPLNAVADKMFEYYGHIHVKSLRAGADNTMGTKCLKHKCSVHLHTHSKFEVSIHLITFY